MRLTYFGHSAFMLEDDDHTLLLDPWLSENPHSETDPETIDDVDAVLVTHAAFDHVGDAPAIAERTGADLLCDFATHTVLRKRGFPEEQLFGYLWGPEHVGDGWSAKVLEARHASMALDEGLTASPLAYLVSIGGHRVYHMGDTSIFKDIELFADLYDPTVGLVPVGQAPGAFVELYPDEAALATEWLDVDVVVPMHYQPASGRADEFARECRERGLSERTDVTVMEPDSTIEL